MQAIKQSFQTDQSYCHAILFWQKQILALNRLPIVSLKKEVMMRKFIQYHVKPIRCVQFYGQVSMHLKALKSAFKLYAVDIKTNSRSRNNK